MFSEMTSSGCKILTFITRISHSVVFILDVFSEMISTGCRKITFITWISYSFMFTLNMISEMIRPSCRILTFITWIFTFSSFLFLVIFDPTSRGSSSLRTISSKIHILFISICILDNIREQKKSCLSITL